MYPLSVVMTVGFDSHEARRRTATKAMMSTRVDTPIAHLRTPGIFYNGERRGVPCREFAEKLFRMRARQRTSAGLLVWSANPSAGSRPPFPRVEGRTPPEITPMPLSSGQFPAPAT